MERTRVCRCRKRFFRFVARSFSSDRTLQARRPPPDMVELFVCGRLCLLGEHSDWAGAHRHPEAVSPSGKCLVVGTSTSQGLHARLFMDRGSPNTFTMTSTDDTGVSRTKSFPLDDPEFLQAEAKAGGFWSHVAGTLFTLLFSEEHVIDDGKTISQQIQAAMTKISSGIHLHNYKTTLPIKKGLSSSAAVCVLVARAFSEAFGLHLDPLTEAKIAYSGERETPSKCGRMDQAGCAFGPGKLVVLSFTGEEVHVEPILDVGHNLYLVVADLNASKDTVGILSDLQSAFRSELEVSTGVDLDLKVADKKDTLLHLLGNLNHDLIANAVRAIASGDVSKLGEVFETAQSWFDNIAGVASPTRLGVSGSPVLHATRRNTALQPHIVAGKGVGSQGDGSVQFLCETKENANSVLQVLAKQCNMRDAFVLEVPATSSKENEKMKSQETTRDSAEAPCNNIA